MGESDVVRDGKKKQEITEIKREGQGDSLGKRYREALCYQLN